MYVQLKTDYLIFSNYALCSSLRAAKGGRWWQEEKLTRMGKDNIHKEFPILNRESKSDTLNKELVIKARQIPLPIEPTLAHVQKAGKEIKSNFIP